MNRLKLIIYFALFFLTTMLHSAPNFVLIGPPGAGKGTFAEWLVRKHGYHQICPGALLRAEAAKGTPLGQAIKEDVESGRYISPTIVWKVVLMHLEEALSKNTPFVLDGFPKNEACLDLFTEFVTSRGVSIQFIYLFTDIETSYERMISRIECLECDSVYNSFSKQPKTKMICDLCGKALVSRKGDDPATVRYRLDDYFENIAPLINKIKGVYSTVDINTSQLPLNELETLYERVLK